MSARDERESERGKKRGHDGGRTLGRWGEEERKQRVRGKRRGHEVGRCFGKEGRGVEK